MYTKLTRGSIYTCNVKIVLNPGHHINICKISQCVKLHENTANKRVFKRWIIGILRTDNQLLTNNT